ncbi:hypothetical protein V6N13_059261 [Hibiscus sabdariffa]
MFLLLPIYWVSTIGPLHNYSSSLSKFPSGSFDFRVEFEYLSSRVGSGHKPIEKQRQDDKGDVSTETTGPAQADISAGIQISAERLALLLAYP